MRSPVLSPLGGAAFGVALPGAAGFGVGRVGIGFRLSGVCCGMISSGLPSITRGAPFWHGHDAAPGIMGPPGIAAPGKIAPGGNPGSMPGTATVLAHGTHWAFSGGQQRFRSRAKSPGRSGLQQPDVKETKIATPANPQIFRCMTAPQSECRVATLGLPDFLSPTSALTTSEPRYSSQFCLRFAGWANGRARGKGGGLRNPFRLTTLRKQFRR